VIIVGLASIHAGWGESLMLSM